MGWRAGEMAVREAMKQKSFTNAGKDKIDSFESVYKGIFENEDGLHWKERRTG